MNIFDALILGIVEGITEFLPVSSTGHMILTGHLLGLGDNAFAKSFEIIIQLGAILAVVYLYWDKILKSREALVKVLVAFLPTAFIGLAAYSFVKKHLLGNDAVVVASLFVGGIALVIFEKFIGRKAAEVTGSAPTSSSTGESLEASFSTITYKKAVYLGVWQSIAMVPGVSRSAATIVGGEIMGISRKTIVEFSFLLAIPTMLSATALDVYKHADTFHSSDVMLLVVGFVTAFAVALLAVKSFLSYIQKHSFASFGYYRIVIALLYAALFLL
jgi:undecaprenyl-diphosphatase